MPFAVTVFDAYGTLFDTGAPARAAVTGAQRAALLAGDWRRKQLEYTWLRAITGHHAPFDAVTADALDWAMAAQGMDNADLRRRLLDLFDRLPLFPEATPALNALRAAGVPMAILSNGTPAMLDRLLANAGISPLFDAVLSVEEAGVFKPDARVYALVCDRFGCAPDQVLFVSANGWDAAGAAGFGFRALWINRAGVPQDRLPHDPMLALSDLTTVPEIAVQP